MLIKEKIPKNWCHRRRLVVRSRTSAVILASIIYPLQGWSPSPTLMSSASSLPLSSMFSSSSISGKEVLCDLIWFLGIFFFNQFRFFLKYILVPVYFLDLCVFSCVFFAWWSEVCRIISSLLYFLSGVLASWAFGWCSVCFLPFIYLFFLRVSRV